MKLEGKYIWIWELDRSEGGDIGKIIKTAKEAGIDGFIIKTHDGSNFWHQSYSIQEFKDEGIKIGAWGYCYGRKPSGDVNVIKKVASLKPDFYVMDVEAEFEAPEMYEISEEMLLQLKDIGIPLGYTSFAIPSYHSVPFDVFSKHCSFTMPQIYWTEMRWQVDTAFFTSFQQYEKYGLPVYPIGQITKNVPTEEIVRFNTLCRNKNITMVSYWDYQQTGSEQLNALKESIDKEFSDAVSVLQSHGIIQSPDYWFQNAVQGKTVSGEYARILINKSAAALLKQ